MVWNTGSASTSWSSGDAADPVVSPVPDDFLDVGFLTTTGTRTRSLRARFSNKLDVGEYLAGNGETEDSTAYAALTSAINTHTADRLDVVVPPGTYVPPAMLTVTRSGVRFILDNSIWRMSGLPHGTGNLFQFRAAEVADGGTQLVSYPSLDLVEGRDSIPLTDASGWAAGDFYEILSDEQFNGSDGISGFTPKGKGEIGQVRLVEGNTLRVDRGLRCDYTISGNNVWVRRLNMMRGADVIGGTIIGQANGANLVSGMTAPGTVSASATTGSVTLTSSLPWFDPMWVGSSPSGNGGKAQITAYISPLTVTATVTNDFDSTSATSGWTITPTSPYSPNGIQFQRVLRPTLRDVSFHDIPKYCAQTSIILDGSVMGCHFQGRNLATSSNHAETPSNWFYGFYAGAVDGMSFVGNTGRRLRRLFDCDYASDINQSTPVADRTRTPTSRNVIVSGNECSDSMQSVGSHQCENITFSGNTGTNLDIGIACRGRNITITGGSFRNCASAVVRIGGLNNMTYSDSPNAGHVRIEGLRGHNSPYGVQMHNNCDSLVVTDNTFTGLVNAGVELRARHLQEVSVTGNSLDFRDPATGRERGGVGIFQRNWQSGAQVMNGLDVSRNKILGASVGLFAEGTIDAANPTRRIFYRENEGVDLLRDHHVFGEAFREYLPISGTGGTAWAGTAGEVDTVNAVVESNWGTSRFATYPAALIDRMGLEDITRAALLTELYETLVDAGIWAKLDGLWDFTLPGNCGLTNWVSDTGLATVEGAPVFDTRYGVTGDAIDDAVNTGWKPSGLTQWQLATAHLGVVIPSDRYTGHLGGGVSNRTVVGASNNSFRGNVDPYYPGGTARVAINSGTAVTSPVSAAGRYTLGNRKSGGTVSLWADGVKLTETANAAVSVPTGNITALRHYTNFMSGPVQMVHAGGELSDADCAVLNTALTDYILAVQSLPDPGSGDEE